MEKLIMRMADCHPEKKYHALGFCEACYSRHRYANNSKKWLETRRRRYAENPEEFRECGRRNYAKNPQKRIEAVVQRRAKNPENAREIMRRSYRNNFENNRAYKHDQYAKNPEKFLTRIRRWQAENPDKCREYNRRRRARKLNGTPDPKESKKIVAWERRWRKKNRLTCYWCEGKFSPKKCVVDHIVALAGTPRGFHVLDNVCISCTSCNSRKHTKDPDEWSKELTQPHLKLITPLINSLA